MKLRLLLLLFVFVGVFRASAQDLVVYDDALENGWADNSWATVSFANTTPLHSGSRSISVNAALSTHAALYLHHVAFNPLCYQSLSFWIYPTAAATNELKVQATLGGTAQLAVNLSFTAAQINQWQQVTILLSSLGVANNANFDGFWIQNISNATVTFYVDDVSLIAVPTPNPAQVTVDAQSVVRTIDSRIFGINMSLWDTNLAGPVTASFLKTMDSRVVRFPGGSGSDDYNWRIGGPPSGAFQWGNNASTFASIAEAQGAQAYITVNYGSGTPEQAAAWVAYYNGNASNTAAIGVDSKGFDWKTVGYWASMRGSARLATDDGYNFLRASHPAPFGFRYWEIGNECYGSWENDLHGVSGSGLSGVAHDPYTYAQAFASFFSQMMAVDPTIRIGAAAVPGEDKYGIGTHAVANPAEGNSLHTGWTPVMLSTLKASGITPHFLIHHYYPQNPGNESDWGLLQNASGEVLAADAADLRAMITNYVGGFAGSSMELAVTELNSVTSNAGKQSVSLVNGLFLADTMGQFAQTECNACLWWSLHDGGHTTFNNSAALYGWRQYGDYGVLAFGDIPGVATNTPFPSFYTAKLLTKWGRGGDSVVSATSSYGLLSVYAAKLANGSVSLLVINKHPTADVTAQIALHNFTPGSSVASVFSYGKGNDVSSADLTTGTAGIPGAVFSYTFPSYSMSVIVVKGQYEAWLEQNFTPTELSDPFVTGGTAQPAGDGVSNLMKYALALQPKTQGASGQPVLGRMALNGKTYGTLTFTQQSALTDISYNVQVSSDLKTWQSGSLNAMRMDDGTTNTAIFRDLTAIEDAPKRFLRLSVTRP